MKTFVIKKTLSLIFVMLVTILPCTAQKAIGNTTTKSKTTKTIPTVQKKNQTIVRKSVPREDDTQQNIAEALCITKEGILGIKMSDKVASIRHRKMATAISPKDGIGKEGPVWTEIIKYRLPDFVYVQNNDVKIYTGTTKKCLVGYNNDTEEWYWNDDDHLSYLWAEIQVIDLDNNHTRKKELLSYIWQRLSELCVSMEKESEYKYTFRMDNGLRFDAFYSSIDIHLNIYDESVY